MAKTEVADLIVPPPAGLEHHQPRLQYLLLEERWLSAKQPGPLGNLAGHAGATGGGGRGDAADVGRAGVDGLQSGRRVWESSAPDEVAEAAIAALDEFWIPKLRELHRKRFKSHVPADILGRMQQNRVLRQCGFTLDQIKDFLTWFISKVALIALGTGCWNGNWLPRWSMGARRIQIWNTTYFSLILSLP